MNLTVEQQEALKQFGDESLKKDIENLECTINKRQEILFESLKTHIWNLFNDDYRQCNKFLMYFFKDAKIEGEILVDIIIRRMKEYDCKFRDVLDGIEDWVNDELQSRGVE